MDSRKKKKRVLLPGLKGEDMGPVKSRVEGATANVFPVNCFELQTPTGIQACKKKIASCKTVWAKERERERKGEREKERESTDSCPGIAKTLHNE